MMYLAYRVSTHHHYGEHPDETHESLIDASTDLRILVARVNEHFALPHIIKSERGVLHVLDIDARRSKPIYQIGGGGTNYTSYLEIRVAPTLVKTHRAREALWYGKKDDKGKFPADQTFGEWVPITTAQASSYASFKNWEVEPLPTPRGYIPHTVPLGGMRKVHPEFCRIRDQSHTRDCGCAFGQCREGLIL